MKKLYSRLVAVIISRRKADFSPTAKIADANNL